MVKRVEAGSSKGGEFAPENKGKVAPTTKIEQNLVDSLKRYNTKKDNENESSGFKYGTMFKKFAEAQENVNQDVLKASRGQFIGATITTFKKIEEDTMREASEAALASKAFANQLSDSLLIDSPVSSTIFTVAMEEAVEKAEQATLKYLAAVEARRAYEAAPTEEYNRIQLEREQESW